MNVYAHSIAGMPVDKWQPLASHLRGVAELAARFASEFGSEKTAALLGLLHDLGKSRKSFQDYLLRQNGIETDVTDDGDHAHAGVGACFAVERWKGLGRLLAYPIAGHHAGLPDWADGVTPLGALSQRIQDGSPTLEEAEVKRWIANHEGFWNEMSVAPPWPLSNNDVSFWIRMLYSCLTDADFLDTEQFMDAAASNARSKYPSMAELSERFFARLDAKHRSAPRTDVNALRVRVRADAESAAAMPTGMFSLSVPTGGGKTLSAMAFAFRHALRHGLDRIVYVIPYTSIIEQTADVLRQFLGDDAVVEHHSNLDPEKETQQSRLASENWDAPVIVTTSVQFFESLYACKPSRCRKLHNIANSVVILDEVQLLPPNLLWPCTEALAQLVRHYHASVVLSTATQPALDAAGTLKEIPIRKIVTDERALYEGLKRVEIEMPKDRTKPCDWDALAAEIAQRKQVLCIVNRKADCRELAQRLEPHGVIYLTTNLCGAHRSRKVAEIKKRLSAGESVRVVSTQLIEAGVDVDFPIVYRAYTGYASIVQAAGRCNREGKQKTPGRVVVFVPPSKSPVGVLRKAEDAMTELLAAGGVSFDDPEASRRFYVAFYERQNDDGKEKFYRSLVQNARKLQFQFREAAAAFKMIGDATVPVIVRYGDADKLIEQYRAIGHPVRDLMRKLQRYTVAVYRNRVLELQEKGFIEELPPAGSGIYVQTTPSLYGDTYGFELDRDGLDGMDCIV